MKLDLKSVVKMAVAGAACLGTTGAFAHVTFLQKDSYTTADGRSYIEGKSAVVNLNLGHACGAGTGSVVGIVTFPNGSDNEVYDITLDANLAVASNPVPSTTPLSNVLTGDAISGMKAEASNDWHAITAKKDATGKIRAIHWHGGWVPDEQYGLLSFRPTFAKFKPESCVSKVRIYMPSSQYCATYPTGPFVGSHFWVWAAIPAANIPLGTAIPAGFTVAPGYASYVDLDRDLKNNPLPKSCGYPSYNHGDEHNEHPGSRPGKVMAIYPSVDSLTQFLPHVGGNPATPTCPAGYHLQHNMETMTDECVPN